MIIETIFSTQDASGLPNFAPMGITLDKGEIIVRPYRTTQTYRNLLATGYGVINFTDDVNAYVQSALFDIVLPYFEAQKVPGVVFQETCSWREIEIISTGGPPDRSDIHCRQLFEGHQRDFIGFCRASNAVIEAAILATRLHIFSKGEVLKDLERYKQIVLKTGGQTEKHAFQQVCDYIGERMKND
ncbi:MAG: DUF447 family protein [Anaerolineaceae bacterium]|nr:DUF447 family protein [Anaerolineaceae bacterium]